MSHLLRRVGISALVALCFTAPAFARSVTIAWDANTESDLAGYVVRYGTAPGNYTVAIDVGNRTDFALTLDEFTTYYVAVEAYDVAGDHSPLSSEVVVGADYSTCDFSLNSTSANIGPSASSLTVGLTAQSACPWNAVSYSSWITISGRTANSGSGMVSLAITANSTGMSRYGTVAIGGRSLLIIQGSSGSCTVSATAGDVGVFLKDGGTASIAVTASGTQCGWGASSDASWLTFSGSASRTGTGSLVFTVAPNA
jgi:Viral BACON domain